MLQIAISVSGGAAHKRLKLAARNVRIWYRHPPNLNRNRWQLAKLAHRAKRLRSWLRYPETPKRSR